MIIPKSDIDKAENELTKQIHADSVFRDIEARQKERSNYEKRWFWELLQNAKDSIGSTEKVCVKIEISDTVISFSHTGNPFELNEILSLIIQGSSKDDREEKTGRFGTGFMTTYLLSKEVEISGSLSNNRGYFSFLLNRNANSKEEFRLLQENSIDEFKNSVRPYSYLGDSLYQTKFSYNLDENGKNTARIGLESLSDLIPVTQLFNEKIESVLVIESEKEIRFSKSFKLIHKVSGQEIIEWIVNTEQNGVEKKELISYVFKKDDFETCILTQKKDGIETLFPLTDRFPRLFYTFPLIGTEKIGIPIIINSTKFDPRVERDGVYLKDRFDSSNTSKNKTIIREALKTSTILFAQLISDKNVNGLYELFGFNESKEYDWVDQEWLEELKNEIIESLSSQQIIKPFIHEEQERVCLKDLIIPCADSFEHRKRLWDLMAFTKTNMVCKLEELENWFDVIRKIALLSKQVEESSQLEYVWDIYDLINFVEEKQARKDLQQVLYIDDASWLNQFYELIDRLLESFPLDKKILLNQEDILRKAEGAFWDDCNEDDLIIISKLVSLNFGERLISRDIKKFSITGVGSLSLLQSINDLKARLNSLNEKNFPNLDYLECNAKFIRWLINRKYADVIKELKVLAGAINRGEETYIYDYFPKSEHLLLSPKPFFEKRFPLYATLIRDRDCLHEKYDDFLSSEDYLYLESSGFIHSSPLVVKNEIASLSTLDLLVESESDLNLLRDNEGQLKSKFNITFTDFAYLTASNGNIYDRNKSQKSSLDRFRFLLLEAIEKDPYFEKDRQVITENVEKPIVLRQCLWVYRAKRLNWINIKTESENSEAKFIAETPSSKNLSELLKGDKELTKEIKGVKQQRFLNKLGIGVSDLIRNTLPTDELRQSWDKAITNLITSDVDPELVQEMFNDPGIRQIYENRQKERKLIKRNQDIGRLIEELFKEYIQQLSMRDYSINIERRPFGSDFIITDESSDLVNNHNEREGFKINNWLIELKATGKNYAAMTPLQAKTASDPQHTESYALIVVPLDGTVPDINYIKTNARVISDIGSKISTVFNEFDDIEKRKELIYRGKNGISVNIDDQNIRFKVDSIVWLSNQLTIEDFLSGIFRNALI